GNLGRALANFSGFAPQGFRIVAVCDSDPSKIGTRAGSVEVRPVDALEALVASERVGIGIIATPAAVAQLIADRFVATGVTSLLNFAPVALQCPPDVHIREVDLASELQILSFQMTQSHDVGYEAIAK
ncbi:MAG: redox-sensing transcriptional repressor Rex, partial [Acidimicrobiia bacterium]